MRAARESQQDLTSTLANVKASRDGLTDLDAEGRLQREGFNEVAHDKPPRALVQFFQALNNPFIYVLLILAGISFFTDFWLAERAGEEGDLTKVIIIMTMVALGRNTARPSPPKRSRPWSAPPPPCCAANSWAANRRCAKYRCVNWWPATSCTCRPAT